MPKAKRSRNVTIHDSMGPEPTWLDQNDLSEFELKIKIGNALNWYNYFYDKKKGKSTLISFLKKRKYDADTIKFVQKAPDWCVGSTIVAIAKMRTNGLERQVPGGNTDDFFESRLANIIVQGKQAVEPVEELKPAVPVISIKQRTFESACKQAEPIEIAIEEFVDGGYKKSDFDCFKFLRSQQIKGGIAKVMRDLYVGET